MAFTIPPLNFNAASSAAATAKGNFEGQNLSFGGAPWIVQLGGAGDFKATATATQTTPAAQPAYLPTAVDTSYQPVGFSSMDSSTWLPIAAIAAAALLLT